MLMLPPLAMVLLVCAVGMVVSYVRNKKASSIRGIRIRAALGDFCRFSSFASHQIGSAGSSKGRSKTSGGRH